MLNGGIDKIERKATGKPREQKRPALGRTRRKAGLNKSERDPNTKAWLSGWLSVPS